MIKAASRTGVTTDTYESMAKFRYASDVGIAVALDEPEESKLEEAMLNQSSWSSNVGCSSVAELEDNHILVIAPDPSSGNLRAVSDYVQDAIDAGASKRVLDQVKGAQGKVIQGFDNAEVDPSGSMKGKQAYHEYGQRSS